MIAVCMAFFSPCDYGLPKRHLAQTLSWLAGEGVPAVLAQVVRPGQSPQPVPAGIQSLVYESSDVMFYKESLWNLAARSVDADKLFFVDTDIVFSAADVIERTASLLDRVDVCQPFDVAVWHNADGVVLNAKRSAAYAMSQSYEPHGKFYHPGFSWAMSRSTFDRLGGIFDRHVLGGGDMGLTFALDRRWVDVDLRRRNPNDAHFATTPSYQEYRKRGASLGLRIGCLENVAAVHQWHGNVHDRQYQSRGTYMPLEPGEEYPVHARADGLLEWDNPHDSDRVLAYFSSRKEDGK